MSKQCLDISQMQHLRKLGVDTSKASMALVYRNSYGDIVDWDVVNKYVHEEDVGQHNPYIRGKFGSFTLQDILDLLPNKVDDELILFVEKGKHKWRIGYTDISSDEIFEDFSDKNFIDASYEMLCWCIENGYIKTNKEE